MRATLSSTDMTALPRNRCRHETRDASRPSVRVISCPRPKCTRISPPPLAQATNLREKRLQGHALALGYPSAWAIALVEHTDGGNHGRKRQPSDEPAAAGSPHAPRLRRHQP